MDAFRQDVLVCAEGPRQGSRVLAGRDSHTRRLSRRQHRHLHRRPFRAAPPAALSRVAPGPLAVRRLPRRRRRARGHIGAELRRPAGDDRRVLVGRPVYAMGVQSRPGNPRRERRRDECDAFVLRGARNDRGSRALVRGGRRHTRQEQGRPPQLHLCGAAARGHRCRRRTPAADGRRGLRRRRRAAGSILLPESRDPRVRATGVRDPRSSARTAAGARTTSCWRGWPLESRSNGPRPGWTRTTPP